jgi:NADH-quinone oxidoreductase subunit G
MPVKKLYDRAVTVQSSSILQPRMTSLEIRLNPEDAKRLGVESGAAVMMSINGHSYEAPARVEELIPKGQVLIDRSSGVAAVEPLSVEIKPVD